MILGQSPPGGCGNRIQWRYRPQEEPMATAADTRDPPRSLSGLVSWQLTLFALLG